MLADFSRILLVRRLYRHERPQPGGFALSNATEFSDVLFELKLSHQSCAGMMHDGSWPFDKAQGPEHSRGTKSPENAFLVKRISCKCFEFHVSGFKLCESDW